MPPDNTASAQLERVLYILPAAAGPGGVDLQQLAAALGVEVTTVLRDLQTVTARDFYHPGGTVDTFSVLIEHNSVRVHAPTEFHRPVRLNARETLALGLGLRLLASDAEPDRRRDILALAERLESQLAAPEVTTAPERLALGESAWHAREESAMHGSAADSADAPSCMDDDVELEEYALAFDDDGFRSIIADAIELSRLCTIWYLKPGDVAPAYRTIAPYRLVYAEGRWYVAAYDMDREALRFFRMDRVLNAAMDDEPAPDLPHVELTEFLRDGGPYMAGEDMEVSVRYSPRVARWIAERTPAYAESDGSVIVRHRVADPRWIVRHVLQYGGEAVIDAPAEARQWVAAAAADFVP